MYIDGVSGGEMSEATSVKMKGMTKIPKVPEKKKKIRVMTNMMYVEVVTN